MVNFFLHVYYINMKIAKTTYTTKKGHQSFKAIPLAKYNTEPNIFVTIYQLEKRDLPFVTNFLKNINQYFKEKKISDFAHKQVMEEAFGAVKAILSSDRQEKKAKSLLAISNMEPCGILVGNVVKKRTVDNKLVYSSRKNNARKETELDWLTTWNPKPEQKMKNIGKAIASEYYNTVLNDGFRDIYVRSEVPEKSYAVYFYKSIGFEELFKERKKITKYQTNRYLIGNYDNPKDEVIPMIVTRGTIVKTKEKLFEALNRSKIETNSIDINTILE